MQTFQRVHFFYVYGPIQLALSAVRCCDCITQSLREGGYHPSVVSCQVTHCPRLKKKLWWSMCISTDVEGSSIAKTIYPVTLCTGMHPWQLSRLATSSRGTSTECGSGDLDNAVSIEARGINFRQSIVLPPTSRIALPVKSI